MIKKLKYPMKRVTITRFLQKTSHNNDKLDTELITKFNHSTNYGSDMSHYSSLLEKGIEEIVGRKEELGIASLFHKGGTSIVAEDVDKIIESTSRMCL